MLIMTNKYRILRSYQLLLRVGGVAIGLVLAMITTLRELLAAADLQSQDNRSIQNSDLIGDYNFRTQQFDSGTDPSGWYKDEP